jgi:glucoamylase
LPFFQSIYSSAAVGTYASSTSTFTSITSAVQTFADGFVAVVAKYTPSGGGLSEQYDKSSGTPTSAIDLTWSYAAAVTAFEARAGKTFASWGAKGLTLPSSCSSSGGGGGGGTVAVTFKVYATTVYGENIYLVGSVDALQNWSPDNAILMSSANYPTWSCEFFLHRRATPC